VGAEVCSRAWSCVVGVSVRDNRFFDFRPGVNVEPAPAAEQS